LYLGDARRVTHEGLMKHFAPTGIAYSFFLNEDTRSDGAYYVQFDYGYNCTKLFENRVLLGYFKSGLKVDDSETDQLVTLDEFKKLGRLAEMKHYSD